MSDASRRIRAARAFGRFSQPEMAEVLEMSEKTYKLIELDQRTPKRSELLAIAEACEVPVWFLESGWDGWAGEVEEAAKKIAPATKDPMRVAEEAVALVRGPARPSRQRRAGS